VDLCARIVMKCRIYSVMEVQSKPLINSVLISQATTAASQSPVPILRYFDIRGKAEAIRLLWEEAGQEYKEVRISRDEWMNGVKEEYFKKGISPFGQLPVVSIGDEHFAQTMAILRYYAKRYGMYGKNELEQFHCDMIADGTEDWRSAYGKVVYSKDFAKDKEEYLQKTLPHFLGIFEKLLCKNENGTGFFVGKQLLFCDLLVFDMLELNLRLDSNCLSKFPLLAGFYNRIATRPRIANYIRSGRRPEKANNSGNG